MQVVVVGKQLQVLAGDSQTIVSLRITVPQTPTRTIAKLTVIIITA